MLDDNNLSDSSIDEMLADGIVDIIKKFYEEYSDTATPPKFKEDAQKILKKRLVETGNEFAIAYAKDFAKDIKTMMR